MRAIGATTGNRLLLSVLATLLGACASLPEEEPVATVEPVVEPEPVRVELPPPPREIVVLPAPEPPPPVVAEPPVVAIVLSGRQSAYEAVAAELAERLERVMVYDLGDKSQSPETAFHRIGDSNAAAVVAIGLAAARAAVDLARVPVVFCQVFNYRDAGLVTDNSRGVAALAPPEAQLAAWRKNSPGIVRIGAIIGEGHDDLVAEAVLAAELQDVELRLAVVGSDQEAQYQFRRMVNEIDGFWLFPDARILSTRSLRDMLAQAQRRNVEVAVSSEALLDLGASISIASVPADIAATVIEVIERIQGGQLSDLPELTPLSAVHVVTR